MDGGAGCGGGGLHRSNTQGGTSREVAVVAAAVGSILGTEEDTEEDRTATVLVDTGVVLQLANTGRCSLCRSNQAHTILIG